MNEEERVAMLDGAIYANEETIGRIRQRTIDEPDFTGEDAFAEVAKIIVGYAEEHGVYDITMSEFNAAFGRRMSLLAAQIDQSQSAKDDMERVAKIVSKATFDTERMNLAQILREMDRLGELSDEDRHVAEGVFERMPTVRVPKQ
jgi:hypothetical protein